MKSIVLTTLITGLIVCTSASAMTYSEGLNKVRSIETKYNKCMIGDDETELSHGNCIVEAEKQYDGLIKSIRKQHPNAVNPKVWQAVNLGHIERAKACSDDNNYLLTRVYYVKPNLLCEEQAYKSLALSAIKLHLK